MSFVFFRKKRINQFSIHFTHFFGTEYELFPNVVCMEVRNLMDSPVVIFQPNFRFKKNLKSGNNAHGNSATGDYEIKFRKVDSNGEIKEGNSYATMMLRHRDIASTFIPIDDDITENRFLTLINPTSWWGRLKMRMGLGSLYLSVAIFKADNIEVVKMKIPLLASRKHHKSPYLGGNSKLDIKND